jgi:hypothetical protein
VTLLNVEEPKVTSNIDYKSSLPIFCYKIPKPQIRSNNLHNLYIGFMVHYFHFSFWNFAIVLEEFDSQHITTFDVRDAWKWRQNYDWEIISGLTFYMLIVF